MIPKSKSDELTALSLNCYRLAQFFELFGKPDAAKICAKFAGKYEDESIKEFWKEVFGRGKNK